MKKNATRETVSLMISDSLHPIWIEKWKQVRTEYRSAGYRLLLLSIPDPGWNIRRHRHFAIPGKDLSSLLLRIQANEVRAKDLMLYLSETGCGEFSFPPFFRSDSPERFSPYTWRRFFNLIHDLLATCIEPTAILITCRSAHQSVIRELLPFVGKAWRFSDKSAAACDGTPSTLETSRTTCKEEILIGARPVKAERTSHVASVRRR
jgi:hypothetical protein